jgi:leucyl aminopeptidase
VKLAIGIGSAGGVRSGAGGGATAAGLALSLAAAADALAAWTTGAAFGAAVTAFDRGAAGSALRFPFDRGAAAAAEAPPDGFFLLLPRACLRGPFAEPIHPPRYCLGTLDVNTTALKLGTLASTLSARKTRADRRHRRPPACLVPPHEKPRMDITTSSSDPFQTGVDLLGLLCHEETLDQDRLLDKADAALGGLLRRAIREERFLAKPGQTLTLHTHGRLEAQRIALIGAGPRSGFGVGEARLSAGRLARVATSTGATTAALATATASDPAAADELGRLIQPAAEGLLLGLYRFDKYLSAAKRTPVSLKSVRLYFGAADGDVAARAAIARGEETARAVAGARDLVNEPAGYLTPRRFAELAQALAVSAGADCAVLGPDECRQRGMGLYLAVAQGSAEEPRFIHLTWKPPGATKRVVLVGKGVTFDSGGLSLKTNEGMLDMKVDMSGAAAVLSALGAVARQKLAVEVHAIAPCTENMPSGTAYKLGDVLRSMSGKTVEINNTDAEGRLTLADGLTYGLALQPDVILDFATLTGACVVALGPHTAGVMSNDDGLSARWLAAAKTAGEDMWPLPLPPRLVDQLKSEVADMRNTGERWGGALTAGLFLREFVGNTPWVHVDIAGPASTDKEHGHIAKGGTGFAVATILEFLRGTASTN